jgi:hypothetical protein
MIAYDCNGKVLNIGDEAIKIITLTRPHFLGKTVTVISNLEYQNNNDNCFSAPGYYLEIKYHDGSVHHTLSGESFTVPHQLMKITPDSKVKHKEKEYVLVNR